MLDQIIYTRCSKHRSLENGGREENQDGSTVYSMSESIFSNYTAEELSFVEKMLRKPNASSEKEPIGLLTSYEYYMTPDGKKVFSRLDGRPFCEEKRKNGVANRGGTIINQSFLGECDGYPFEVIDSPDWTAVQRPEIEYYHDDAAEHVPYLPAVRDLHGGGITADIIRNFLNADRKETYQKALYFLMQEFSKNENERKVLLIKDNPQNVALWIAAFSLAMSPSMAEKLTFSTNRTNLGMQTDSQLFYYTDESGKIYYSGNQNPNLKRKPYYMVVGYHALDRFSRSLREYPNSNYVILDGETFVFGSNSAYSVSESRYFQDACLLNQDMNYFCSVILDNYSAGGFTGRIPELYEAYYYLLTNHIDVDQWEYSEVMRHLDCLDRFAPSKDSSYDEKIFTGIMQVYPIRFHEDENNHYKMIKALSGLSGASDKARRIRAALVEKMAAVLEKMGNGDDRITGAWNTIYDNDLGVDTGSILRDVLSDNNLRAITEKIGHASDTSVSTVLDMYIYMIENGIYTYRSTYEIPDRYAFVVRAFDRIKESEAYLRPLLARISDSIELTARLLYSVVNGNISVFHKTVVETCPDIMGVVRTFSCYEGASFHTVDSLMKWLILKNRACDGKLLRCYGQAFEMIKPDHCDTSEVFEAWLSVLEPDDLGRFFSEVYHSGFSMGIRESFIEKADHLLHYDEIISLNHSVIHNIADVADAIGVYSETEEIYKLYFFMKQAGKPKKTNDMIAAMKEFSDAQIVFRVQEKDSKFIQTIFMAIAELKNGDVYFGALQLFSFDSPVSEDLYIRQLIHTVFSCTGKQETLSQIVALSQVKSRIMKQGGKSNDRAGVWEDHLIEEAIPYYKPAMMEQVKKMSCALAVEKNTLSFLKKVDEKAPKGLGGRINSFLGKWKKT